MGFGYLAGGRDLGLNDTTGIHSQYQQEEIAFHYLHDKIRIRYEQRELNVRGILIG